MAETKNNTGIIVLIVIALVAVFGFIIFQEAEQPDTPAEMVGEQMEEAGDSMEDMADEMDDNM